MTTAPKVRRYVPIYARPASTAPVVGRLRKDEVAELVNTAGGWQQVRLASGRSGFVEARWTQVTDGQKAALVVTFVDVGEGDAILLQLGAVDILVDTGPSTAWKASLGKALASVDGPLDLLFITHPHADHYGGAIDVLAHVPVAAVYTNAERRGPPRDAEAVDSWDAFAQAAADAGLRLGALTVGTVLHPAEGLTLEVLATGDSTGGQFPDTDDGSDINNDSLVLRVEYAGRSILLTGDVEKAGENLLLERYCVPRATRSRAPLTCPKLHADVLKVPHHGSASFEPRFFATVVPTWAVVSAGYQARSHCLPRAETFDALARDGAKLVSTSADRVEPAALTITAAGVIAWRFPTKPAFAWRKRARPRGMKCGLPVLHAQDR